MRTVGLISVISFALAALVCAALPAAAQGRVEDVSVRLKLSGEPGFGASGVGPEAMEQLEGALTDTVRVALLDQLDGDLAYITEHQSAVAQTLGEVIGSTLDKRGFVLEELVLEPGPATLVTVSLHLSGERVEDFSVIFSLLGDTPVMRSLTESDAEAVAADLIATLARTPYGDARWLSSLVTDTVRQRLAAMPAYADFEQAVVVEPGPTTKVVVAFTPRAGVQAVTDYRLRLRSLTLLNSALTPVHDELAHDLLSLRGAPLSFINDRLGELQQALYQQVINHPALARHCAEAQLELGLSGCALDALVQVESQRYLATLSARLALWDYTDEQLEGRIAARLGLIPQAGWAALAALDWFPAEGQAFPMLGAARLFDSSAMLAAGWDFQAESLRLLGSVDLAPDVYAAGDVIADGDYDRLSEISLHYRIRDVYELQLASNLEGEVFAALAANF